MVKKLIKKILNVGGVDLKRYNRALRDYQYLYEKYHQFTMVPEDVFISNLDLCHQFGKISGDYVECGVWRGGISAALAEVLGNHKTFHLFDSFEGLPPAKEIDGAAALAWQGNTKSPLYFDNCRAEESFVIQAMKLARHPNYQIHKGWFEKTLPVFNRTRIAILRLDGDWYESILVCLDNLFPKVVQGGLVLLDDYYAWDGCSRAVHDYFSKTKSVSRIHQWNNQVPYIIKKEELP